MCVTIETPGSARLADLGVADWPVWEKEVSTFPWAYDDAGTCFVLAGRVTVTPENGTPVRFGAGQLVRFPAGMRCEWVIHEAVRKRYRFG